MSSGIESGIFHSPSRDRWARRAAEKAHPVCLELQQQWKHYQPPTEQIRHAANWSEPFHEEIRPEYSSVKGIRRNTRYRSPDWSRSPAAFEFSLSSFSSACCLTCINTHTFHVRTVIHFPRRAYWTWGFSGLLSSWSGSDQFAACLICSVDG